MTDDVIRRTSRLVFLSVFTAILGMGIARAVMPAGAQFAYAPSEQPEIGPENRVVSTTLAGESVTKILDDNVYFTINSPIRFTKAEVNVVFENPDNQEIIIGFKDRETWHYSTKLIQSPTLDKLTWNRTGIDPVLFQKSSKYSSVAEFFSQYSSLNKTGGYYYPQAFTNQLEGYIPKNNPTIITNPRLRGFK